MSSKNLGIRRDIHIQHFLDYSIYLVTALQGQYQFNKMLQQSDSPDKSIKSYFDTKKFFQKLADPKEYANLNQEILIRLAR